MSKVSNVTPRSKKQGLALISLTVLVSCIWNHVATKYSCGLGIAVVAFSSPTQSRTKTILPRFRALARSRIALSMSTVNSTAAVMMADNPEAQVRTMSSQVIAPTVLQRRLYERHQLPLSDAIVVEDREFDEEKKDDSMECDEDIIIDVKTLIWEVEGIIAEASKDGNLPTKFTDIFYVVTALQMKDKIEMRKLKDLVLEKATHPKGTLTTIRSMQLAPLKVAESLTGFQSGCMPPICHTNRGMDLYVDKSIMDVVKSQRKSEPTKATNTFASIGSGIPGKSLVLPLHQFLRVAGVNEEKISVDESASGAIDETQSVGAGFVGSIVSLSSSMETTLPDNKIAAEEVRNSDSKHGSHPTSNEVRMMSGSEIRKLKQEERRQQREAKKDRLQEYRSFNANDILSKAKLLRTTARKKGRVNEMEELIQEALAVGDFPKLMKIPDEQNPNTNIDKNALHICAWRGDFESVVRLVEISNQRYPELDVVNMISKGPGNYGKTPIFYALTQCRDDVVTYLVQEAGADLLIVNNKGQTPCSIARSHVSEETCKLLYETEAKQLAAKSLTANSGDELFANHRAGIHSDKKLYGDLDPRFPIDDDNRYFNEASRKSEEKKLERRRKHKPKNGYDPKLFHSNYMDRTDDLTDQIKEYEESVKQAPIESKIMGVPTQFSPRSLRPTVRWWNRDDRSLANANDDTSLGGQITFTQSRPRSKKDDVKIHNGKRKEKERSIVENKISKSSIADIDSLDLLSLDDVTHEFSSDGNSCVQSNKIVVDNAQSLRLFEDEVDNWISELDEDLKSGVIDDERFLLKYAWGIDCEWKPGPDCGEDSPVSTLQLGTRKKAFLVDLQTMCKSRDIDGNYSLENELDRILQKLFLNQSVSLVGYGVLQDLGKLAASFPHLKCFSEFVAVVDLQSISSVIYRRKFDRRSMSSLQKMTAVLLNKRLDKTQQVSDWSRRPLSEEQISYAMLDAAIVPLLLSAIFDNNAALEGYNGGFFNVHKNLISTIRYIPVEPCKDGFAYEISHGTIKSTLGKAFARQSWPTKMKFEPPELPKLVKVHEMSNHGSSTRTISKKERAHLRKIGADELGNIPKRPKPIPLKTLFGNLDNLPKPGLSLGYTKESCAFRVVGHELFKTIPEGTYIGFNRRSGVAETSNAWILFCNFGGEKVFSEFSDKGRKLSFRVNSTSQMGRSSEACLYREMVSKQQSGEEKPILLFARSSTRTKYLFCGACTCSDVTTLDGDTACLSLELNDYEELMDEKLRISTGFEELVNCRL